MPGLRRAPRADALAGRIAAAGVGGRAGGCCDWCRFGRRFWRSAEELAPEVGTGRRLLLTHLRFQKGLQLIEVALLLRADFVRLPLLARQQRRAVVERQFQAVERGQQFGGKLAAGGAARAFHLLRNLLALRFLQPRPTGGQFLQGSQCPLHLLLFALREAVGLELGAAQALEVLIQLLDLRLVGDGLQQLLDLLARGHQVEQALQLLVGCRAPQRSGQRIDLFLARAGVQMLGQRCQLLLVGGYLRLQHRHLLMHRVKRLRGGQVAGQDIHLIGAGPGGVRKLRHLGVQIVELQAQIQQAMLQLLPGAVGGRGDQRLTAHGVAPRSAGSAANSAASTPRSQECTVRS
jgi:hypothetical protein